MRILELTNFTAGGCGVWHRAKKEAEFLSQNNEVLVMSSNIVKGTKQIAPETETIGKIKIRRFPIKISRGSESFMDWSNKNYSAIFKEAEEFKPNVIIAHSYRHPHTMFAKRIGKKTNAKVFLVTHAPFARDRKFPANLAVWFYDHFTGPNLLKQFTKIIAISKWEIPYLRKLGVPENKIVYIPNGIDKEFFSKHKTKRKNKGIFTGRIAPIKSIETISGALLYPDVRKSKIKIDIFGPAEPEYKKKIDKIIAENNLSEYEKIIEVKYYTHAEQIKELDESLIFILPSKSEGMPQALIEAMARGCICIASNIPANRDIIIQKVNGLLFEKENPESLARAITYTINLTEKQKQEIRKNAIKKAKEYDWKILIKTLEKTLND